MTVRPPTANGTRSGPPDMEGARRPLNAIDAKLSDIRRSTVTDLRGACTAVRVTLRRTAPDPRPGTDLPTAKAHIRPVTGGARFSKGGTSAREQNLPHTAKPPEHQHQQQRRDPMEEAVAAAVPRRSACPP
ncbi:hypothetical protein EVAR_74704_1 [Eumeta japonica]|uniref:Uncharacterized protein n=1 Tax=Eumeta variegata TaxID=151549 RepID=A0A4C1YMT5_EUMVA|nr:hypothetical protein EVAR_74704_1 [Eumeta japonica]